MSRQIAVKKKPAKAKIRPKPLTFKKFAILLHEPLPDAYNPSIENEPVLKSLASLISKIDMVEKLGDLLKDKIKEHAEMDASLLSPKDILETSKDSTQLLPIMYRVACENFAKENHVFKIIECRHVTNVEWKPSLPQSLISNQHQVLDIDLNHEYFLSYDEFAYAILRQLKFKWSTKLPKSIFHPDDICSFEATPMKHLIVISPSMPGGDFETKGLSPRKREMIEMFKQSCVSSMKFHFITRDLKSGNMDETLNGILAIRTMYKKVQNQLKDGSLFINSNPNDQITLTAVQEPKPSKLEEDCTNDNTIAQSVSLNEIGDNIEITKGDEKDFYEIFLNKGQDDYEPMLMPDRFSEIDTKLDKLRFVLNDMTEEVRSQINSARDFI